LTAFGQAVSEFWGWVSHELKNPLVLFGFAAQFVFFLRFAVQWAVSEWKGHSHIPVAFWYLSLAGGLMTFIYAVMKKDLVFMTAQALGVLIYVRNLMLIYRPRTRGAVRGFPVADAPEPVGRPRDASTDAVR
jgi:lipid-A-disaccharide synthase-like uncharacterized protein